MLVAILASTCLHATVVQTAFVPAPGAEATARDNSESRAVRLPAPEIGQGATVTLTATADGLWPMTYQWYKDGVLLVGVTGDTLLLNDIQPKHAGKYTVTIANARGRANTPNAALKITAAPVTITNHPKDLTAPVGGNVTLAVTATGPMPSYQWFHDGAAIAGATKATLVLTRVKASDAGDYQVRLLNNVGSNTFPPYTRTLSTRAKLTVSLVKIRGAYFGKVASGDVALVADDAAKADLVLNLAAAGRIVVARGFTVAADGSFAADGISVDTAAGKPVETPVTITGAIHADGSVTGSLGDEAMAFTAARSTYEPDAAYYAPIPGTAHGTVFAIGDVAGNRIGVATLDADVLGGSAIGPSNDDLRLSGRESALTLHIDRTNGSIRAVADGISTVQWSGLRSDLAVTGCIADISARCRAGAGERSVIAGFVVSGSGPRMILIRGVGPTLASFGVGGFLPEPRLTVYRDNEELVVADAWSTSAQAEQIAAAASRIATFPLIAGSRDAAVVMSLPPGRYSAILTSRTAEEGVALIEVYDAEDSTVAGASRLTNLSARGPTGTGEDAMIAGFVINGNTPKRVLLRGVGPALAPYGVNHAVEDPVLTLRSGSLMLGGNDDWAKQTGDTTPEMIQAAARQVGAFGLPAQSADAAMLITLGPGSYTVEVSGKTGGNAVTLAEVYEAPALAGTPRVADAP